MSLLTRHGILLVFALVACLSCKSPSDQAELQEVTPLGEGQVVDLTRYTHAGLEVYNKMRQEMTAHGFDYAKLRSIVDGIQAPANIHKDELVALRLYTSDAYAVINDALRTRSPADLPQFQGIIKTAASGLNKVPRTPCVARRGTSLPEEVLDSIQVDKRFVERAFLSATYAEEIPEAFSLEVTFVIQSEGCRKIDWLSEYPDEREVLFPPGSEFLVTSKRTWMEGGMPRAEIHMRHVPGSLPGQAQPVTLQANTGSSVTGSDPSSKYAGRTYISESLGRKIHFGEDGKVTFTGIQTQNCTWKWSSQLARVVIDCPFMIWYFRPMGIDHLARIERPRDLRVVEFFRPVSEN